MFDEDGGSAISGADFALAVVNEIDTPAHHRTHIGIAYRPPTPGVALDRQAAFADIEGGADFEVFERSTVRDED